MDAIQTERLTIRNFVPEDWQDLRTMIVQYQASPYAAYDHQWPTSEDELRGVAKWFANGDSYFAVCLRPMGTFIGFVCLNAEAGEPVHDLGYIFNSDHHGRGYATEACRAIVDHAFAVLGAERVVTGTAAANEPSCRLLERVGLKRVRESVGSLSESADGKPIEFVGCDWALSRDEWQQGR
jgi:RimJ/RimL family protein N-acetyltransferase